MSRRVRTLSHFVGGEHRAGVSTRFGDIFDPNVGSVQARVPLASVDEVDGAVRTAVAAQRGWASLNPQRRARVMFEFKRLIEVHMDDLAQLISSEHGKVVADAKGDIQRGLEVVEFACGVPHLLKGEVSVGAGPGIDVFSVREPLGVVVGITPFNFPAMIPLWMCAPALAAGNAFILKPSEKAPSAAVRLGEFLLEAGLPAGVFNVVHGDKVAVDALLDHRDVKAVSFVGSSDVAQQIYVRAAASGKRCQAMGGAKNHGIVLPDADLDRAVDDIVGAAFGSAGERCMALPVVVPVGEKTANALRDKLVSAIAALRVGVSTDPDAHYGPLISAAHRARVESYIELGQREGAELVVDGRGLTLQGHEGGFFLGPCLFDRVTPDMKTYHEEIFGPVLQIVRAETASAAMALASEHQYGNGVAVFTRDGQAARTFAANVHVGMVGINVPIPVPVAYHSFGGWKRSAFGDLNQYGMDGVRFYTRQKIITQRWAERASQEQSFVIPTMG